jgi:hypothetical protein
MIQTDINSSVDNINWHQSKCRRYKLILMSVCIIYVWIGVILYNILFLLVSVYMFYVLGWCQSISSTFGFVTVYIVYAWIGVFISSTFELVSVYIVYVWIGVSLYRLRLDWCQFISSTFVLVSVYIVYVCIGVSFYHLRLYLCEFLHQSKCRRYKLTPIQT